MAKKPTFRSNPTRTEEHVSTTNPPTNEVMMNAPVSSGKLEVPRPKADAKKAKTKPTSAAGSGNAIPINLEKEIGLARETSLFFRKPRYIRAVYFIVGYLLAGRVAALAAPSLVCLKCRFLKE